MHAPDSRPTAARVRARLDSLLFNREVDEQAIADEIAAGMHGESVGSLPSPAAHRGVGIAAISTEEELSQLPPHIAAAVRRQHERAKAAGGVDVPTPLPSAPDDPNVELT